MEKSNRSAAPVPADQVPALVLSADGLEVRRDPGAPELHDSAMAAAALAESIGAQLGLPDLAALEVRLDVRQLMLMRRPEGGLEVRQLMVPARPDRIRWTGGAGADQPGLDSLRDVPGVHGSFVISDLGRLLASDFPTLLDEASTAAVGLHVLRLCELFPRADESLILCTLRYGAQLLFLRAVQGGMLCVLAAATVSLPAARMAMTLVANRYSRPPAEASGPKPMPVSSITPSSFLPIAHVMERTGMLVTATAPLETPDVQAVLAQATALRPTGMLWKLGVGVVAIAIGMVAVTIALVPVKRHRRAQLEDSSHVIITSSPTSAAPPAGVEFPPPSAPPAAVPLPPAAAQPAAVPPPEPADPTPARIAKRRLPRRPLAAPPPELAPERAFSLGIDPPPRPRRPIDPRDPYALDNR